jgi:hypothetical protein
MDLLWFPLVDHCRERLPVPYFRYSLVDVCFIVSSLLVVSSFGLKLSLRLKENIWTFTQPYKVVNDEMKSLNLVCATQPIRDKDNKDVDWF